MIELPKSMKAVQLKGYGDFDQLEYRDDVAVPKLDSSEVLVQVGAAAVNNTEINHRIGWYAEPRSTDEKDAQEQSSSNEGKRGSPQRRKGLELPRIQGADVCGRIVAVGSGVNAARIGERVLIDPLFRNPMGYFGADCDGGFAEFTKATSDKARRIESSLTDVELASFPCSYSTAENLVSRACVAPSDTVLVTGASGGVGSAVVQLAKRRGATIIGVTTEDKAEEVRRVGADETVDRSRSLVETCGANSVDVVIDLVGGPLWNELLEVLKPQGRYATSGAIAGPMVVLDLRKLYFKDLTVFGATAYEPALFDDLIGYIEKGEIKPLVAKQFPLKSIVEAQKAFLRKEHVGKIVLIP